MELKQLRYFVTIADEGSISAAAVKLFMSQPPLSAQMKLLESELGCCLFERGARRITLTEQGRALYSRACAMLDMERVAKEEILEMGTAGTVRLGVVSSVLCSLAEEWICGFCRIYNGTRFEITEGNTYTLLEKLKNHTINLAVIRTPFSADGVSSERLFEDRLVALGKRGFLSSASVSAESLSSVPLIVYRRWEKIIRDKFSDCGANVDFAFINDDARTTVHFVESGLGVGIVPASTLKLVTDADTVSADITGIDIRSDVVFVRNARDSGSDISRRFCEYLLSSTENSHYTEPAVSK